MWRSIYLRRLLLFSVILVAIPVITLGYLSYLKTKEMMTSRVIEANMQTLEQTQLKAEQLLQTIDYSLIQFINSSRIGESVRKPVSIEEYSVINEIREGLYRLQTYEKGIENARLVSLDGRWVLDNSGYSASFANLDMKALSKFEGMPVTSGWFTDQLNDNVRLIKKIPVNAVRDPAGLLEAILPSHRLNQLVPEPQHGSETFILDTAYHRLTHTVDGAVSSSAMEQIVTVLKKHPASGYTKLDMDGRVYGMNYRLSGYNGWIYVSMLSIDEIAKESSAIGWYTLWICTTIFIGLAICSLFASRRMYMPIRRVFESAVGVELSQQHDNRISSSYFPNIEEKIETIRPKKWAQDELRAISDHIHSLRFSQSSLLREMEKYTVQLRGLFVRKLLTGEMPSRDIQRGMEQVQYSMNGTSYCVLAIQTDTFSNTRFEETDRDLLLFAVSNIVGDLIPPSACMVPIVLDGKQVTLLMTYEVDRRQQRLEVQRLAEKIQLTVKDVLGLDVSMGISRFHQELGHAAQAYNESAEALKYRIRFGEHVILHVEDILQDQKVQMMFPEWIEKRLIDALHVPDVSRARECLRELLDMTLKESHTHEEYQMILFRLLSDLIREFQSTGDALRLPSGENLHDLFEQLMNLKTSTDVERWFMSAVMEPIIEKTLFRWGERNAKISQQMLDIIHEHLEQDLTLETCAAKLNYHPNYLKTVFRKETGENFSEYVSRHRLQRAKQLLVGTDMKIGDIAERMRYRNAQNFIRYFRKVEQMTPGEYRKKHQ